MTETMPAPQVTHQHTPPVKDFWQVVMDILDNPFIPPCERDGALFAQGFRIVNVL